MYYNFKDIKFAYGASDRGKSLGYFTEITTDGTTYNSENTTETTGGNLFISTGVNASVRLLTLPEMNKMLGRTDIDSMSTMTDPTGMDGIFVLKNIKNLTSMSAYKYTIGDYWLTSVYPGVAGVCYIFYDGNVRGYSSASAGVRPVVSLMSDIQFTDTNGDGALELIW